MEIVRGGVVSKLLEGVPILKMFRAKQSFPGLSSNGKISPLPFGKPWKANV